MRTRPFPHRVKRCDMLRPSLERGCDPERLRRALIRASALTARTAVVRGAHGLTERERQVLGLLAQGLSQQAIARELVVSPQTVATHIKRTLAKLNLHSRAEAVAFAHREQLVEGRPVMPSDGRRALAG